MSDDMIICRKKLGEEVQTMENKEITAYLLENAEEKLRDFSGGLIPGRAAPILGVRLPKLRELAKRLAKEDWQEYLKNAADHYMEETLLQGMTLGYVKADFGVLRPYLERFVTKIDNWSVCDSTCTTLKIARRQPQEVREWLQPYLDSEREFEIRFAVVMLLAHYITEEYIDDVLEQMGRFCHDGYYAKMAVAWNLSVCFVKFPQKTYCFLEKCSLDDWTYNKSIQKMLESYRVDEKDKICLRNMKRK